MLSKIYYILTDIVYCVALCGFHIHTQRDKENEKREKHETDFFFLTNSCHFLVVVVYLYLNHYVR